MIDRVVTKREDNEKDGSRMPLFTPPPKEEWVNDALLHMGYPDVAAINPDIFTQTQDLCDRVGEYAAPGYIFKSEVITRIGRKTFSASQLTVRSGNWAKIAAMAAPPPGSAVSA